MIINEYNNKGVYEYIYKIVWIFLLQKLQSRRDCLDVLILKIFDIAFQIKWGKILNFFI
jgi:hypothetical protein